MAAALRIDGKPITVAGHSFGALVALHWAAQRSPSLASSRSARRCTTTPRRPTTTSWPWACSSAFSPSARTVPVVLAEGARDPVPVPGRMAALADTFDTVTVRVHPSASHDLPIAYAAWCRALL